MSNAEKPKFVSSLAASIQKEEPPPPKPSSSSASRKPLQKKPSHDDGARQPHTRPPHAHGSESGHHKSKSKKQLVYAPVKKPSQTAEVVSEPTPVVSEAPPPAPMPAVQPPPPATIETKPAFKSSLISSAQSSNAPPQPKPASTTPAQRNNAPPQPKPASTTSAQRNNAPPQPKPSPTTPSAPHEAPKAAVSSSAPASRDGEPRAFQSSLQKSASSKVDEHVEPAPKKTLRQSIEEKGLRAPSDRAFTRSSSHSSHDDTSRFSGGRRHDSDFRSSGDLSKGKLSRQASLDRGPKQGPPKPISTEKREPSSILSRLGPPTDAAVDADSFGGRQPPSVHSRLGPSADSSKRHDPLPRSSSLGVRHASDDGPRSSFGKEKPDAARPKPTSARQPAFEKPPVKGGSSLLQSVASDPPPRSAAPSFAKAPVKGSSLVASINNMDSLRLQLTSSLELSMARSKTPDHARQALNKTRYTVTQLRALNSSPDAPRPSDLMDLTKISVTPASPRKASKSASRFSTSKATSSVVRARPAQSGRGATSTQRGGKGGRGGQKGKGSRYQPPPPPLSDEPIVPFVKSETRWVPSKEQEKPKDIHHQAKTLLNKLTRDQFEKITAKFQALPVKSLETLNMIIALIMDKALEEPNFAEVYADLCARMHQHIAAHPVHFLHAAYHVADQVWYWTAANRNTFPVFHGPVSSRDECLAAAASFDPTADGVPAQELQAPSFFVDKGCLVVVATKDGQPKGLYYAAVKVDQLNENEPLCGPYATEQLAMKDAVKLTSFKRLLITRCQDKFDSTEHKPKATDDADDPAAARAARRTKTLMLGNMRFLGELFKVELIAESVVQACIFKLLGLELVQVEGGAQAAQTIRMPDEEDLEALCKMLATVGKKFDNKGVKTAMTMIVVRMVELSESPSLPSRIRFLLKDVLEMRDYQWVPRRQELQQKTLQEVRKEAEKLQKLGKNAQHDDLQGKRHRAAHSSLDVAKQNSTLLLRQPSTPIEAAPAPAVDPTNRIKSILQEYQSLHDIEETRQCVAELPRENHVQFVEHTLSLALEGKDKERLAAVDMLVGLYETLHLGATEIQSGLLGTLEFLDDIQIDIPMVHEYCGHILGRLIGAGCFALTWLRLGVAHLAESGLAGKLLVEVLSVMDDELGFDSVAAMVVREELNVAGFLPPDQQSPDAVAAFLKLHDLASYFDEEEDGEDEEDDEEVKDALHSMVHEYFVVQDLAEVDACLRDLDPHPWAVALVKAALNILCDCKEAQRPQVVTMLRHVLHQMQPADLDAGLSWWLDQLDDVVIDVPQAAQYVAPVVALVLQEQKLAWPWVASAVEGAREATRVQLVEAICTTLDSWGARERTRQGIQDSGVSLAKFASGGSDRLSPWFA